MTLRDDPFVAVVTSDEERCRAITDTDTGYRHCLDVTFTDPSAKINMAGANPSTSAGLEHLYKAHCHTSTSSSGSPSMAAKRWNWYYWSLLVSGVWAPQPPVAR